MQKFPPVTALNKKRVFKTAELFIRLSNVVRMEGILALEACLFEEGERNFLVAESPAAAEKRIPCFSKKEGAFFALLLHALVDGYDGELIREIGERYICTTRAFPTAKLIMRLGLEGALMIQAGDNPLKMARFFSSFMGRRYGLCFERAMHIETDSFEQTCSCFMRKEFAEPNVRERIRLLNEFFEQKQAALLERLRAMHTSLTTLKAENDALFPLSRVIANIYFDAGERCKNASGRIWLGRCYVPADADGRTANKADVIRTAFGDIPVLFAVRNFISRVADWQADEFMALTENFSERFDSLLSYEVEAHSSKL